MHQINTSASPEKDQLPHPDSSSKSKLNTLLFSAFIFIGYIVLFLHIKNTYQNLPLSPHYILSVMLPMLKIGEHFTSFWLNHSLQFLKALAFFMTSSLIGHWMINRSKIITIPSGAMKEIYSLCLGLLTLGLSTFALLKWGLFKSQVLPISIYITGAISLFHFSNRCKMIVRNIFQKIHLSFYGLLLFACLGIAAFATSTPEIFNDALVYHLRIPQVWLDTNKMPSVPLNIYSNLPLFTSTLYLWGLKLGGLYVCRWINFGLGLILISLIYQWANMLGGKKTAVLSALLYISMPLTFYMFWSCYADLGYALFLTLSLFSFWLWIDSRYSINFYLLFFACFGGAATACKYPAAFGLAPPMVYALFLLFSGKAKLSLKEAVLIGFALFFPVIPWWAANVINHGNPFFPMLHKLLGGKSFDPNLLSSWNAYTDQGRSAFWHLHKHLLFIYDSCIGNYTNNFFILRFIGPAFLSLLGFGILTDHPYRWKYLMYTFSALLTGLCFAYYMRYFSSMLIPSYIICACGIVQFSDQHPARTLKTALHVLTGACILFNIYWITGIFFFSNFDGLSVGLGREKMESYIKTDRSYHPVPAEGAFFYLRDHAALNENKKVLVEDEVRPFYCPSPNIAHADFDIPVLYQWARDSQSLDDLIALLDSQRIRTIVFGNKPYAEISGQYSTPKAERNIEGLLRSRFNLTYQDNFARIYERKE